MHDEDAMFDAPKKLKDANLHELNHCMINPNAMQHRDLLGVWGSKKATWPHLALLARLYAGVDSTSRQAKGQVSHLTLTLDNLHRNVNNDEAGKRMLLRLNKHLIPLIPELLEKEESTIEVGVRSQVWRI